MEPLNGPLGLAQAHNAGLLGWLAGSVLVSDPGWHSFFGEWPHLVDEVVGGVAGIVFVLGLGFLLRVGHRGSGEPIQQIVHGAD